MPHLLTCNRLETGEVLWWTGEGWNTDIRAAAALEKADAEALIAQLAPAERVNDLAAIEAEANGGGWRPLTTRERVRASGPSVRPDLALVGFPTNGI